MLCILESIQKDFHLYPIWKCSQPLEFTLGREQHYVGPLSFGPEWKDGKIQNGKTQKCAYSVTHQTQLYRDFSPPYGQYFSPPKSTKTTLLQKKVRECKKTLRGKKNMYPNKVFSNTRHIHLFSILNNIAIDIAQPALSLQWPHNLEHQLIYWHI